MGELLQFNRQEIIQKREAATTSEKLSELDNERQQLELNRSNLISFGEDIFEGSEMEKSKQYMATMQAINRKLLEIKKEMQTLSKQLEVT